MLLECVVRRQARRPAHGSFRPSGIAAAQLRQRADVCDRIIDGFALMGRAGRNVLRDRVLLALLLVVFVVIGGVGRRGGRPSPRPKRGGSAPDWCPGAWGGGGRGKKANAG